MNPLEPHAPVVLAPGEDQCLPVIQEVGLTVPWLWLCEERNVLKVLSI